MSKFPVLALSFALLAVASPGWGEDEPAAEKTAEVKVQDLVLAVPAGWERSKPSSNLRLAQFEIPMAKGDEEPTQLVIYSFPGGGGGVDANLKRWLSEFQAQGRKTTLRKGKSPQGEYVLADITGEHVGTSFSRRKQPLADGRLLGAILTIEGKGIYFLKMVGQDATVGDAAAGFRRAIGAEAKGETEYEPGA